MEEPPANPTGPVVISNEPSFTPPPTRRGPGFMTYCLGCMGVGAVVSIIAIFFIITQVKKGFRPITAANVQSALPTGVTLHPSFKIVEKDSKIIAMPSKGVRRDMSVLVFETPEPISVIGPWYETRLAPQGWTGGASPKTSSSYAFQKGDVSLTIQGRPAAANPHVVTMTVVRGIPLSKGTASP